MKTFPKWEVSHETSHSFVLIKQLFHFSLLNVNFTYKDTKYLRNYFLSYPQATYK